MTNLKYLRHVTSKGGGVIIFLLLLLFNLTTATVAHPIFQFCLACSYNLLHDQLLEMSFGHLKTHVYSVMLT